MVTLNINIQKNCYECILNNFDDLDYPCCHVTQSPLCIDRRPEDCPIGYDHPPQFEQVEKIRKIINDPLCKARGSVARSKIAEVFDD